MNRITNRIVTVALVVTALAVLPLVAQVKDYGKIKYPELPEFQIARPEVFELPNGMTLFLMQDNELPLITAFARIRTGSNYEPVEKTGLAGIMAQAMREGGTTSMTGDEIDDYLAARAATVETGMGGDFGTASMNCLKDDFEDVLKILAEVLQSPKFSDDKIDLAKQQVKTGIARRNDDIAGIAGREFRQLIYGDNSPLTAMPEYATVESISRDDLVAWHEKYYHPNNVYLGVVGDFEAASMKRSIESAFKGWARGPDAELAPVAYREPKAGVNFVEKTDVTQAYVRLGHLGIETKNPDFFAVQVMNEVFGGGFAARLFSNVRSEKGLAYSVGGGVGSSPLRPGIFQVALSTKSETMAESVDALKEEINGIINNPASEEELERAKEAILNSFVFNYASMGQILGQQLNYAYYGLPADFLEQYRTNIEKVTTDDVARVAKNYIHPDKLVLLVVGNDDDFDKPVSEFGAVKVVDISIPPPPETGPALIKNAETMAAGSALLAKAASAMNSGSTDPVQAVRSKHNIALQMQGQEIALSQEVAFELPNKVMQKTRTPMGESTMIINGDKGIMQQMGQSQPLPSEAITSGIEDLGRDLLVLTTHADHSGLEAVAAGSESVEGTNCDIVAVSFMGSESRLFVDADGRVVKQAYQGQSPITGAPGQMDVHYMDYRDVEGRMVPFKNEVYFDGQKLATIEVEEMEINPELDESIFEIPGS